MMFSSVHCSISNFVPAPAGGLTLWNIGVWSLHNPCNPTPTLWLEKENKHLHGI
jgi:hypothetical protein